MEKTFTLEEANTLLPVLEALLKRAIAAKQTIETTDQKLQLLTQKVFLMGGILIDIPRFTARKLDRDKAVQEIKDSIAEITASGVQVKDLDLGLLDFPCVANGETVLLCWKLGEPHSIEHWHGLEEGFIGRKPISALNLDKKRKTPEKPN
jgi:hypothetical protein